MKETPIIYSSTMIRAYLEGRKTTTRRLSGLSIINDPPQRDAGWQLAAVFQNGYARFTTPNGKGDITLVCPYGGYGDKLWVREAFKYVEFCLDDMGELHPRVKVEYRADGIQKWVKGDTRTQITIPDKWRPSIFMPRWASRITQTITEIRVERLQEITQEDIAKEGEPYMSLPEESLLNFGYTKPYNYTREHFAYYWDSLNAKRGYSWESNLWVWVLCYPAYNKEL